MELPLFDSRHPPVCRCSLRGCSFGGVSPERRAAQSLQSFFTFVAARVVMSQLEGIGRGDLGSYNAEASRVLRHFLENEPLGDASAWLAQLTQENEMLGASMAAPVPAAVHSVCLHEQDLGSSPPPPACTASTFAHPRPPLRRPPIPHCTARSGVRIMEVRAAYASEDFEWDNLQRLAVEGLAKDNVQILRKHASQRFTAMLQPQPPQQTVGEDLREQDM